MPCRGDYDERTMVVNGKASTAIRGAASMKRTEVDNRLDAHFRHEMSRFSEAGIRNTIEEEISAMWEWAGRVRITELVTSFQARDFFQRHVVDAEIPESTAQLLNGIVARLHSTAAELSLPMGEVVSRDQYRILVDAIINLEELRHEMVYQAVTSPLYSRLISEVLYNGIKAFIISENVFIRNIPGASSLVSMSRGLMSRTALRLEKQIDKRVIDFIRSHIQDTIRQSERFLNQAMEEGFLEELAGEIFTAMENEPLSTAAGYIDERFVESVTPVIIDGWRQFRRTGLFSDILDDLISHFFDRYGDQPLRTFLENLGITRAIIIRWAEGMLCPLLAKRPVRDFLEERIRSRLASFYIEASNG